jgi:hypothetical protein
MSGLPVRPKPPGYFPGCPLCDNRRDFDGGIACYLHRTAAEWAWLAEVEAISGWKLRFPPPEPTLF